MINIYISESIEVERRLQNILKSSQKERRLESSPELHLQVIPVELARELLSLIRPRDYFFKRKIIFSIRSCFDTLTTFRLIEEWDLCNFDEGQNTWNIIQSYKPGLISIGTVIFYAKLGGYKNED